MVRRTIVPLALLAVVAAACTSNPTAGPSTVVVPTSSPSPLPRSGKEPVEAVVARVLPAVVNVTTDIFQPDPFGGTQHGQGVGTGFIVRSDGVIVTNCHVVEGASKISVFTSDENPTKYDARVIGGDCLHDLAVLKVGASDLPTVPLGSSHDLRLGQSVVALGYALALEGGPTVTSGIVSSLDRTIQAQDPNCTACHNGARTYADVIQTDAAINHGNSGGPLVNMAGEVVGINTAGNDQAENIGFAIAIDSAKDTIAETESDPLAPSAYLGVTTQGITSDLAFQLNLPIDRGVFVLATLGDGPAAGAGIRRGDVIVAIDGHDISSPDDLGHVLGSLRPGEDVPVEIVTPSGDRQSIDVTLGTRPLPVELP